MLLGDGGSDLQNEHVLGACEARLERGCHQSRDGRGHNGQQGQGSETCGWEHLDRLGCRDREAPRDVEWMPGSRTRSSSSSRPGTGARMACLNISRIWRPGIEVFPAVLVHSGRIRYWEPSMRSSRPRGRSWLGSLLEGKMEVEVCPRFADGTPWRRITRKTTRRLQPSLRPRGCAPIMPWPLVTIEVV